jgi:glycosyltransferase involved in cell wall biosynthesis
MKGLELLRFAVEIVPRDAPVELRAAGPVAGRVYDAAGLADDPVSAVHAMVAPSLAPESYGLVLDEARELGLPAVLPRAGAFVERAREGEGVLFFEAGSREDLARVLLRLAREPELLADLRARIPRTRGPTLDDIVARHRALYAEVLTDGPPPAADLPPEEWFAERMRATEISAWDDACSKTPAAALGFDGEAG